MKHKAPLSLMEQMVMIVVFALAAALCLQAFAKSDSISRRAQAADRAAVLCQNVAEAIRSEGGSAESAVSAALSKLGANFGSGFSFDEDWTLSAVREENGLPVVDVTGEKGRYTLGACPVDTGIPGLARAAVWAADEDPAPGMDRELFRLEVSWQTEVSGNG